MRSLPYRVIEAARPDPAPASQKRILADIFIDSDTVVVREKVCLA